MMFKKLCPSKKKMISSSADRKQIAPPPPVVSRNGSVSTTDESDSASGDSLEGLMQLTVNLPDKRIVSMSVEKRMPMMDLLVHVTTANKIPPGGHIIKIVNDEENGFLSYKPSTPIGSLTSSVIFIVPKKNLNEQPSKRELVKSTQPFEPTFRLQVHLPRQQLLVLRVSQQTKLSNIHQMVCTQKGLDSSRYYLQHPTNPDIILDYNLCLADYSLNEINMASRYSQTNNTLLANENFIIPKEAEDKKRKSLFGMFRRAKPHTSDLNHIDKSNRNVTLTNNEDFAKPSSSRSFNVPQIKPTKKRPAPPPPVNKSSGRTERPPPPPPLHSKSNTSFESVHSRQSSDSSGYHDSSVLGDSPEGLVAETGVNNEMEHLKCSSPKYLTMPVSPVHTDISKSKVSTNLTTVLSTSNSSITTGLKKRRAPLPPSRSTSPTSNRYIEKTNEIVMTNISSEPSHPSHIPYPMSSKGNNSADPSPPSSPLSKEIPDACMTVQNGPEMAECPSECVVNTSILPSHVETIELSGVGNSPSSSASPDDRSDDACLPSRLGTEGEAHWNQFVISLEKAVETHVIEL